MEVFEAPWTMLQIMSSDHLVLVFSIFYVWNVKIVLPQSFTFMHQSCGVIYITDKLLSGPSDQQTSK